MLKALMIAGAGLASAQSNAGRTIRLPDMVPPHPDVTTTATLVGASVDAIHAGQFVTLLCGFVNHADTVLNISGIVGSLNDPVDFASHRHNFSGQAIGDTVEPGGEISLEYRIPVPQGFPEFPYTLQMAFTVFYDDEQRLFSNTFFNETVTFLPPNDALTAASMLPYAIGILTLLTFVFLFTDSHPLLRKANACGCIRDRVWNPKPSGKSDSVKISSSSGGDDDWSTGIGSTNSQTTPKSASKKTQ